MERSEPLPPSVHLVLPWRVHALVPDFELLDVWRFGVRGGRDDFAELLLAMGDMDGLVRHTGWATRGLFGLRKGLGRIFGWDRERVPLPIPGCEERSVAARLPAGRDVAEPRDESKFYPVYEDEREALLEISNGTVHALMHLGWIELEPGQFGPQMAVYVKHRGRLGSLYMRAIAPFRHGVVYPSLLRAIERQWRARES